MSKALSEYDVENLFIERLESIGYTFVKLDNYEDVISNFREQLAKFNAKKLEEKGHAASFSDAEFNRIMIHVDNSSCCLITVRMCILSSFHLTQVKIFIR